MKIAIFCQNCETTLRAPAARLSNLPLIEPPSSLASAKARSAKSSGPQPTSRADAHGSAQVLVPRKQGCKSLGQLPAISQGQSPSPSPPPPSPPPPSPPPPSPPPPSPPPPSPPPPSPPPPSPPPPSPPP
eukprot:2946817-Pleurochrysis_carterae.AAC.1